MSVKALLTLAVATALFATAVAAQEGGRVLRRPDDLRPPPAERDFERVPHEAPAMSPGATRVLFDPRRFGADPSYADKPYNAEAQRQIYGGKTRVDGPRPPIEIGYPMYREGPLPDPLLWLGEKNPMSPQLLIYGDFRTAVAHVDNGNAENSQIAARLNVDVDLKVTATERFHLFLRPIDRGGKFTRYEFGGDDRTQGDFIFDGNVETFFFEGDLGAIAAGLTDRYNAVDLPVAAGLVPLFFHSGTWVEDAFVGGAFTIPARNSARFGIANMDFTFFAGFDKVTSAGLKDPRTNFLADHAGVVYGVNSFFDVLSGHIEAGYGYVADTRDRGGFDHNSVALSFTRRYGGFLSNSVRGLFSVGQDPDAGAAQTADGQLFLIENSLITHLPSTLVPYGNFFVGFDRPQSLVRDAGAGGPLKNIGITFETDGLTGFPNLDDSANDSFGGAIGVQYLFNLDRQVVAEFGAVRVQGNDPRRVAKGDQQAIGLRFQQNLSLAWIFRSDVIVGWRDNEDDIAGVRLELRRKF